MLNQNQQKERRPTKITDPGEWDRILRQYQGVFRNTPKEIKEYTTKYVARNRRQVNHAE